MDRWQTPSGENPFPNLTLAALLFTASNPVYVPNTEDLMRQARALSQEVDIFIESDAFTSTAPDGVDVSATICHAVYATFMLDEKVLIVSTNLQRSGLFCKVLPVQLNYNIVSAVKCVYERLISLYA